MQGVIWNLSSGGIQVELDYPRSREYGGRKSTETQPNRVLRSSPHACQNPTYNPLRANHARPAFRPFIKHLFVEQSASECPETIFREMDAAACSEYPAAGQRSVAPPGVCLWAYPAHSTSAQFLYDPVVRYDLVDHR
jgi:hypothetical protein